MASNESMRETLEYFRKQRTVKLDEIRQIEATIHQLEREVGDEMTQFDSATATLMLTERNDDSSSAGFSGKRQTDVRADEFFGLSQPEAARRYLKKIGHAIALDDILDSLRKGGCSVGGADPKKVLYISLVRDTRNFVKLPNGMIGLREFYADRNLKSEKKEKKGKKPVRKKPTRTQMAKKEKTAEAKKEKEKGEGSLAE